MATAVRKIRREAYFSALKFFFQYALEADKLPRREAYAVAKNKAAVYAFMAPTENFRVWVPVW